MKTRYWTCSKFADWLRGTPKGGAKSAEDWDQWATSAEKAHPFRYWLAETALDTMQNVVTWPLRKVYDAKYYIVNRYVTRTHTLTSRLAVGKWHEFDRRMLHCLFDELVNYVEVEEAWSNIAWDSAARKKYNPPFFSYGWLRTRTWRSAEAGLDKLKWAASLTDNDENGQAIPTRQAEAAAEIIALYEWWTTVHPNRPDPMDASGWSEICSRRREQGQSLFSSLSDKTVEEAEETAKALELCNKIEQQYDDEDTEMLIRLVKVRKSMWT